MATPTLLYHIDSVLISFFRLTDIPILGYYAGSALLCLVCVIVGQLTLSLAFRFNRQFIDRDNRRMVKMHNLSVKALVTKNKNAYKNCNKEANDAFGKVFFSQIALCISSLWPVPFALGWMQIRFLDVAFPLPVTLPVLGNTVGFMFTFIPMYILVYILFGKVKAYLPYFRNEKRMLDAYAAEESEALISLSDLSPSKPAA